MASQRTFNPFQYLAKWVVIILFLSAGASAALAQQTANILGAVKDSSGAAVPGTNITARNVDTAQTRSTVTDADGSYRIPALPVGNYEVRAEHAGLKAALRTGLVLTIAEDVVVNITLEVGSVDQTVEVTAEAPLVNTTSNSLGGLVDEHSVVELPLNGRSYVDLTFLTAGVIDNKNQSPSKGSVGHYFSSNGATPRSNNYLLDGATMVTMYGASSASIDNTTLGIDGVQEYRVVTNSFSAEYGMTMGSQMLISSKGGTNTFHGSAFEFLRNSIFDAKNPFDVSAIIGRRLPEFQRNDFGGSFGGPIRKDKTFFFAVFEGLRENKGITTVTNDIPAGCRGAAGATITSAQCPLGTGITSVTVAPQIVPFLAMYPVPNLVTSTTTQYTFPYQQPSVENYGQIRVDHNFSTKDTLFGRYTADNSTQESPLTYPGFLQGAYTRGQFITLSENHIFSSALLNTARTSFSRTTLNLAADVAAATASIYNNPATQFVTGFPEGGLSVSGFTGAAAGAGPIHRVQNIFAYSDDAVYSHGRHSLKFGFLLNHLQQFIDNDAFLKGSITFSNIGGFLQALPSQITAIEPGGSLEKRFHYNTLGFYGQDDFRVTSRLTLNLGLRYEIETNPVEIYGNWSAWVNPATNANMTPTNTLFAKNPSLKNFGPRIGFAWDVFGNGKTSVRGGFAMLYDIGNYASDILQTLVAQTPFTKRGLVSYTQNLTVPTTPTNVTMSLPFTFTAGNLNNAVRPMDYYWNQPRLNSFNLTIERQLPFDMGLSVAYVGSRGYNLDNDMEGNPTIPQGVPGLVAAPGGGTMPGCVARTPGQAVNTTSMTSGVATACFLSTDAANFQTYPLWGTVTDLYQDTAHSWYNSLQVSLTKRLTKGLQFQAAYTWSKDIDQNPGQLNLDTGNSNPLEDVDALHLATDQGRCACDVRNNFKFNTVYYLPTTKSQSIAGKILDGWWVSSIISLQSGYPFSPDIQSNRSLSGTSGGAAGLDRPNLVPGRSIASITSGTSMGCGNLPAGTPIGNVAHWYDPCAFTLQPAGFLGNAGRNILSGPGFADVDLSLVKDTPLKFLGESGKLQFRSEFFNVFNRANFALPNRVAYTGTATNVTENPLGTAGTITATISTSRQIQFALKVIF